MLTYGLLGMVVGLILRVTPGRSIQDSVSFDYQFFFVSLNRYSEVKY